MSSCCCKDCDKLYLSQHVILNAVICGREEPMGTMAEVAEQIEYLEAPFREQEHGQWDQGRSWAAETDDEDYEPVDVCGLCGGPLVELGTLGWVKHYRCRNCGAGFSDSTTPRQVDRAPENGC